jgi:two-component system chemotaxis response regulator CheB
MNRKIKVLIVDDSAAVRSSLTQILEQSSEIEVIGVAIDPYEAVAQIAKVLPDVITLDIEMPRMDGLTFLGKLMKQHPIPVVVISSVVGESSEKGIMALKLGASEIITKPKLATSQQMEEYSIRIIDAIKAASLTERIRILSLRSKDNAGLNNETGSTENSSGISDVCSNKIILLGASTGGTEVISYILKNLRTDLPGMLVVQHMPGEFTGAFAARLNRESKLRVKEAEDGDVIRNGSVYIANGNHHLELVKIGGKYHCSLATGALVNRHRPSVDVLFNSAAKFPGKDITAILLTGMGSDGAKGLLELKKNGASTFAQDEKSSVIFGMPKEAIKLEAANLIGNPGDLINWLNTL